MKTNSVIITILISILLHIRCSTMIEQPIQKKGESVIAYSITDINDANQIYIINGDGSENIKISNISGRACGPDWSPDGSKIVFYNHLNDTTWSLFVMNSDGSEVRRLTDMSSVWDGSPRWSPDGRKIIFGRTYNLQDYHSEIWITNSDGENEHRVNSILGNGPDWSKDGEKILFHSAIGSFSEIFEVNIDGSNIKQITNLRSEAYWPKWSPDNLKIVFQSNKDNDFEIYVINSDGSNVRQLTHNDVDEAEADWSPDGKKIVFASMRDGNFEIYSMDIDGTNQQRITNTKGHAIQPDWKHFQL